MGSCPERGQLFLFWLIVMDVITRLFLPLVFTGGISYEALLPLNYWGISFGFYHFFDIGFRVNRYFFVFEVL